MTDRMIIGGISAFVLTLIMGYIFIPLLKKIKAGQTILCYLEEHFCKSGTPTMGGLFFVPVAVICFFLFVKGEKTIAKLCVAITVAYLIVGFLDDFIKVKFCKNEGLKPMQKIAFQFVVAIISAIFAFRMGLTHIYIPFTKNLVNVGFWIIPSVVFVFIATTNCVNLTDGLDGLASTVSKNSFIMTAILIVLQTNTLSKNYIVASEYINLSLLLVCFFGALGGFLVFNTNKASVFMGDAGSLALGGLFASVLIFSGNMLYIPLIGIMFVMSGISVIMQVTCYKLTGKRIFLIAPLHHHFQHKGASESKIVFCYGAVTFIVGLLCLLVFL